GTTNTSWRASPSCFPHNTVAAARGRRAAGPVLLKHARIQAFRSLRMRVTRGIPAAAAAPSALTIGNFDGVHAGHQAMLGELKRASDRLGVPATVLTFEPHPREFFSPDRAPARLTTLREKLERLAQCGVDRVHVCRFDYALAQTPAE